jgi:hypothetical protein
MVSPGGSLSATPAKRHASESLRDDRWNRLGAMEATDVERAVEATTEVACALGLAVDEATVICNSNKLALRLLPCDVFVRVALAGQEAFRSEIEIARRLAENGSPIAKLDTRVEPRVYQRNGFAFTLWRYYEPSATDPSAVAYATALQRLHVGMAQLRFVAPHFICRVMEAQRLVESRERTPGLEDSDRALLIGTLRSCCRSLQERAAPEQLLHGEPHPGNLLATAEGLLFIDLETCCRGPVEFDLAHVPEAVCDAYVEADADLLQECRRLVLAMVAAWRWDATDGFPSGDRAGRALLSAVRAGPPWPTMDALMNAVMKN